MNTIQRSFPVLRGIAVASLGAAAVWAAAPAQASTDASHAAGLEAARGQAVPRHLPPLREPRLAVPAQSLAEPILVAPGCPNCFWRQDPARPIGGERASEAKALPAPVLMAPGCPSCFWRQEPAATQPMTEPLLVAVGGGCGNACGRDGQLSPKATQQLAEPQALPAPLLVAPGCGGSCRPAVTLVDVRIAPASLLLAGGVPPTVIDSLPWWRRLWA